ncbi:MAG: M23 family metallopeptidase [Treponema sp.]|nr:M23 family metallopeptidase [Treponema sp.]
MQVSGTGKGISLAFFLLIIINLCFSLPLSALDYPEIRRLDPTDIGFRQFIKDVEANRRRLAGARAQPLQAAENLTVYQYTTRQNDDIFFLAARLNIPYSALCSLNRLSSPASLEAGMTILLPSCPGIFLPSVIGSDFEAIIRAARQNTDSARTDSVELRINFSGRQEIWRFFPGEDFTPTERTLFLHSGFRFPLRSYRLTSPYGMRNDPFTGALSMHQGIDLAAPEGTEVFAVADGTVASLGFDPIYGNYIIINHSNNISSLYGHLQIIDTVLRSEVKSGNLIGRVGSTGLSTGPHLHFELRQDGRAFDPAGRLRP